jgi:hypothetical protein
MAEIVAVKITLKPNVEGFADAANTVVVLALLTVTAGLEASAVSVPALPLLDFAVNVAVPAFPAVTLVNETKIWPFALAVMLRTMVRFVIEITPTVALISGDARTKPAEELEFV